MRIMSIFEILLADLSIFCAKYSLIIFQNDIDKFKNFIICERQISVKLTLP